MYPGSDSISRYALRTPSNSQYIQPERTKPIGLYEIPAHSSAF